MEPSDLPVVEYLNQRIVFDLLATVEGGFSQVENVTSTAGRRDGSEALLSGELGSSNIFALIGVKLGASLRGAKETSSTDAVEREVVHTPTSLFARLREYLTDERLVVAATAAVPGAFVEFEAKLRKNPLLDAMEGIVGIVRMFGGITAGDARPKGGTDPAT